MIIKKGIIASVLVLVGVFGLSFIPSTTPWAQATVVQGTSAVLAQAGAGTSNTTATPKTIIQNPIRAENIQCLVLLLFKMAVNVLAFVAVGYIIWAGFLFVKAQGNEAELKKAKQAILNAIIGSILIFGAWVFAEIISRTITSITQSNPVELDASQCKNI